MSKKTRIDKAERERLRVLHAAAMGKAYTFRKQLNEDGTKDLWAIDGAGFASDAEVMCAARNALPYLLDALDELEARLAEVGPVVEAAEALVDGINVEGEFLRAVNALREIVPVLRAARAKREEGGA